PSGPTSRGTSSATHGDPLAQPVSPLAPPTEPPVPAAVVPPTAPVPLTAPVPPTAPVDAPAAGFEPSPSSSAQPAIRTIASAKAIDRDVRFNGASRLVASSGSELSSRAWAFAS